MADSATYAISTVTRGMCLETRANGTLSTGIYDRSGTNQAQLWTIEQDDDKKYVAFRNVSNGQYLRSSGKGDRAKAQYGNKSWWTLEPGDAPALWWLKCNDTSNYLANYGGSQAKNNTVLMWASNLKGWSAALQWYVHPAKAGDSFSFTAGGLSAASSTQREELDTREKALKDREQQLEARETRILEKEDAIKKQTDDIEAKQKAAVDKEADMKKREGEMETEQKALIERQQQVKDRERAISSSETGDKAAVGGQGSTKISDLERQLAHAQQELSKTRIALEKQAPSTKSSVQANSYPSGSGSPYSGVSSDEVVNLRSRILELEAQLVKQGTPTPSSARSDKSERGDLRPIVMQQGFAYLPRLANSELKYPLRVLSPAASVR